MAKTSAERVKNHRAKKQEEARDSFFEHLWNLVGYWSAVETDPPLSARDRVHGVVFSFLVALDGMGGPVESKFKLPVRKTLTTGMLHDEFNLYRPNDAAEQ